VLDTIINILLTLLICSSITFYLGYLFGVSRILTPKSRINPIFQEHGNIYNKPLILGSPRLKGKDDLKEIVGITSALEKQLNELGIFHFDQISKWTSKNHEWVEAFLDIPGQISKEKWISQALRLKEVKKK